MTFQETTEGDKMTCRVEAPSDLPEGYVFDATVDGITVSLMCQTCFQLDEFDCFTEAVAWRNVTCTVCCLCCSFLLYRSHVYSSFCLPVLIIISRSVFSLLLCTLSFSLHVPPHVYESHIVFGDSAKGRRCPR